MNTRFINARILTMEDDCEIFEGELSVVGDRIDYVGIVRNDKDINIKYDRVIDAKGNLLMPGFKDAHTHSAMTAFRSLADDLPLQEWLETKIFPNEAKLDGEMVYEFVRLANLEYLTSGITSIFDMYMFPDYTAKACNDMGMRLVQVDGINKFGPEYEEFDARYERLNGKYPLTKYIIGFHAEYTCTRELLEHVCEVAHKYQSPVYAHTSETELEVKECIERHGMTPIQLMDDIGMFKYGGGGYHCVYFTDDDIKIFKEKNLSVVSNPGSNTKLASGIAPLTKFLDAGINIALGTDGPSSNNCLDMFREMFLATGLGKLREMNAAAVPAMEVLKMATCNGAKAMFLDDCDVLASGKKADIIMIDLHTPNMQPINNIPVNLVYSGSKSNVKMTMIDGKILYEDGKFNVGVDPETIYDNANVLINKLLNM